MKLIPALFALALASPAVAQAPGKPAPAFPGQKGPKGTAPGADSNADIAKRSFNIASVNLTAAKDFIGGLNDLAQRQSTWDRESSVALFNSAQRAVSDAEEYVGRLMPLAKGDWAKASDALEKARADLVKVQGELRTFAAPVRAESGDPASRQSSMRSVWDTLDAAAKDLGSAAKQMSIETKIKTP
jgi:hypothetical protein